MDDGDLFVDISIPLNVLEIVWSLLLETPSSTLLYVVDYIVKNNNNRAAALSKTLGMEAA